MGKILFWVVVVAVGWGAWSMIRLSQRKREQVERRAEKREPERIVACAKCGVHLPASEALHRGDAHYCCAEHRDAGRG
jgi:uncharacterized protein